MTEWEELPHSYIWSGSRYNKMLAIDDALYEIGSNSAGSNHILKYDLHSKSGWTQLTAFQEISGYFENYRNTQ